ncbi:AraC family transcriptional regulator [Pseudomonas umsongensis]|jgi:AraC-like DNA-binding protein|uniref:AraC family transcriptional regulator n=1 Tax=Pseudomonas umsongensis TaxID=198618 RepID=UPI00200A640E|nr:helix-turn-helix domain-containing protein [Pseudomonas umsongensis]MCK8655574.1 helix-turn-helix transcriptional regulator [Pseudomonas umsongensis]
MTYMSPKLNANSPDVFHLETSDTSGYAVDWHAHDCHMLLLPRQGGLFLSTESSQTSHVSRQSFSFVPADFAHATEAAPGREKHMTLYVDPSYVKHQGQMFGCRSFAKQVNRSGIWQATEVLEGILRLHDQLQSCATAQAFERQLPHLNHLLFEECTRVIACQQTLPPPSEQQQQATLVHDIQRYVRENLDSDLTIESIGHEFHLSRRHLTRIFKAVTDETLLDFTNRTRVETAARLVSCTSLSILEVSLAVGLDSPSYLARLFKRYLNLTPSELRKPR